MTRLICAGVILIEDYMGDIMTEMWNKRERSVSGGKMGLSEWSQEEQIGVNECGHVVMMIVLTLLLSGV